MSQAKLYMGGGCFWCLDAVFRRLPGVLTVESGYAGGRVPNPKYQEVCGGTTGHAEVVCVEYDPEVISEEVLLEFFWKCHDPTTPNQQGADIGPQYRSILLYRSEEEKRMMEQSVQKHAPEFSRPIVTEIASLDTFYPAEVEHQNFYNRNPHISYCQYVILPKLSKLGLDPDS